MNEYPNQTQSNVEWGNSPLPSDSGSTGLATPRVDFQIDDWAAPTDAVEAVPVATETLSISTGFSNLASTAEPVSVAKRLVAPLTLPALPSVAFPPGHFLPAPGTSAIQNSITQPIVDQSWAAPSDGFTQPSAPNQPSAPQAPSYPQAPTNQPQDRDLIVPLPTETPSGWESPMAPSNPDVASVMAAIASSRSNPSTPEPQMSSLAAFSLAPIAAEFGSPIPPPRLSDQPNFFAAELPKLEPLILREEIEIPTKKRFGRKKEAANTPAATGFRPSSFGDALDATSADLDVEVNVKRKRFARQKPSPLETDAGTSAQTNPSQETPLLLSSSDPLAPQNDTDLPGLEKKAKRKLFAKVDRSEEESLTPSSGRWPKVIRGFAVLSLLGGLGLFASSFLKDAKSTPSGSSSSIPSSPNTASTVAVDSSIPGDPNAPKAPTPVQPSVDPTAVDPTPVDPATGLPGSNTQLVDPATGLPYPPTDPANQPDPAGPNSTPAGAEGSTQIPETPPLITPGPDDLEFSSGGNFAAG